MVKTQTDKQKIAGTLFFNGETYDLLNPNPVRKTNAAWAVYDVLYLYVINPEGYATHIYVSGNFLVDFSTSGIEREFRFLIDDEETEVQLQNRLNDIASDFPDMVRS